MFFSNEELRLIAALAAGALSNALLIEQLESQNMLPGSASDFEQVKETQMIGLSPGMMQLKKEIEIVAASDLNVLISGETGTGKELVAKAIHEGSPRAVSPLVYLNCAALPESVAESELFGHVKGAFTGAISNRSGKFEMADNGTLFLDGDWRAVAGAAGQAAARFTVWRYSARGRRSQPARGR
ncbi:Anaerobic nitric oxide reductase transcription regulator norR [Kluyvera cryocrescens]|uniref:Anaerobic nitric oxide reductase transcription regulator norR n=1 Tax=Kluyvera cryocrescens TaxID=580 RepID=A0A485AS65_KLUCR|nr:Anaerobic nitric oxide reductase transcription regulator norR [Kluyvera cryocrescens]